MRNAGENKMLERAENLIELNQHKETVSLLINNPCGGSARLSRSMLAGDWFSLFA
jgi:hypothetical protein